MSVVMREERNNRSVAKSIAVVALSILALYLIAVAFLYSIQETMIFHPRRLTGAALTTSPGKRIEKVGIPVDGSKHVRGWLCKSDREGKQGLIIYFGGNAEEVSGRLRDPEFHEGWTLALTNYRGYGESDGKPGEQAFFEDALKIYDYYTGRDDIDTTRVVVMGWSLGTSVATFLASRRTVRAVILVAPFGSIADIARERFPFAPINLILKHRFDSYLYAPLVKVPLLCILGTADATIRPVHSLKLAKKWGGPYKIHSFVGLGHNNLLDNTGVRRSMAQFLDTMQ